MNAKVLTVAFAFIAVTCCAIAQSLQQPPAPPPAITFGDMQPFATWSGSDEFVVSFPSAVTSVYEANNTVPIHILLPHDRSGPIPVVVILHYWGATNREVERQMGEDLNKRGIGAVLMTLPYHLERTPPGSRSGDLAIQADPNALHQTLLQSLQDTRRAIDFVETRPEFDHSRIGVAGLSLGAIVAALVYAVDDRVDYGAFVLGGVDIADILWNSSRVVPQREALRRAGYTEEKLRQILADLEPASYLKQREASGALVVTARYDTVIPPESSQELLNDLKAPKVSYLNTGHYGGFFIQRRLLAETANYFQSVFSGTSFAPSADLGAPTIRLGVQYNLNTGMDIGFGLDVFTAGKQREYSGTALVTPRGLRFFLGRRTGRQLSAGVLFDGQHVSVGALWSTVL